MSTLDDADRRILTQLRLNARITNSALAEAVGLSASACLRRVKLLEQSGVIRGYTAIVAGAGPDEGTVAIVQVELERQTEEYLVRFERALRHHPEVREWYLMTGAGDYVLRVQIAGMEEYAAFHRDVLTRLPGVTRITSSFAMRGNRRA
ncbi:Lrp/AsnC family transcriptional regulator [Sphingomonas sp. CL5.1]|uniref:Lrp/AsnC family transcriptional regulator n=1 Tax=Sphingomonas sp. CL5.1 TaxID=2653203 RepID=UPI001583497E|nr:Lrp/AsnC family transcriptional regulator [Sphingomonas sp. CL5.1]QKR99011.1 Lrp/AsnC family transcriptional regulator [Sphingomonas sp. CL5.1]